MIVYYLLRDLYAQIIQLCSTRTSIQFDSTLRTKKISVQQKSLLSFDYNEQ